MTESQNQGDDSNGGSAGRGWIGTATVLTGLITALTTFVIQVRRTGTPEAKASTSTGTPALAEARSVPAKNGSHLLMWSPADCVGDPTPTVAVDSCADRRPLEWLRFQMDELRNKGQLGFGGLPRGFNLQAADYNGHANYRLLVMDRDGKQLFSVGVGYNLKSNTKDGALRVYQDGHVVGEAWLRSDGSWAAASVD